MGQRSAWLGRDDYVYARRRGRPTAAAWYERGSRPWWLPLLSGVALLLLALEFANPLTYRFPTLRAAVETLMTLLALTAAYMLRVQFAHSRKLRDLLLLGAVITLGVIEFFTSALPAALEVRSGTVFAVAIPFGQLIAAGLLLAAAWIPPDRLVTHVRRPLLLVAGASVFALGVALLFGLLLRGLLLVTANPSQPGIHRALGHPFGFFVLGVTALVFACSARGFHPSGRHDRDGTLALLAAAAILLAVGRLYYLALPWVSPEAISMREGIRVLAFALIFVAAARQERALRAGLARAAAIAERRRVARDLHDGLAQDLAFIAAHGATLADRLGDEHPVAIAARRALAISRGTISDLSDSSSSSSEEILTAIAHELGARFKIRIAIAVKLEDEPPAETREHVGRIAREAIANAARHGGAQNVTVSLRSGEAGIELRVRDDGRGIGSHDSVPVAEGFGLTSMRERAASLGGQMTIRSGRRGGTELEVALP
jgi:signal transduction histidine kinase